MLYRQPWIVLLLLTLVLTFLVSPLAFAVSTAPGAYALSTHSLGTRVPLLEKCAYHDLPSSAPIPTLNTGPNLIVLSNNWRTATYFCGAGYTAREATIHGVNEVYNNGGGPAWFKWYRDGAGYYCAFSGLGGYENFNTPVTITQIDYGDTHLSERCGD